MSQSFLICCCAAILSFPCLAWGLEILNTIIPSFFFEQPAFWLRFGIDRYTVYIFVLFFFIAIMSTGLLPAWRASNSDLHTLLRERSNGIQSATRLSSSSYFVVFGIFLSMIILIVTGIIISCTYLTLHADYGVKTNNILTAKIELRGERYNADENKIDFVYMLSDQLQHSATVSDVIISSALPGYSSIKTIVNTDANNDDEITSHNQQKQKIYPVANYVTTTLHSLEKLGAELKHGRFFNEKDETINKASVIVTDSFEEHYFPNEAAIGKRIRVHEIDGSESPLLTIVGIIKHTPQCPASEDGERIPTVFRPFAQAPRKDIMVALKMKSDKTPAKKALQQTVSAIDPNLPVFQIETYEEGLAHHTASILFIASVFLLFGCAALIFTASGVYSVMSNNIKNNTRHIGVKRALGAKDKQIIQQYLSRGLVYFFLGGIPAVIIGWLIGQPMIKIIAISSNQLMLIILIIVLIMLLLVICAIYLATKHALLLEPSEALRYE